MNSASVAEESHFKLYSCAISFNILSLASPDGLVGESFSMIWPRKQNNPTSYKHLHSKMHFYWKVYKTSKRKVYTNSTIDTRIGTKLRSNHDKFFSIFCTKEILNLKKIRHFRAPWSSKDNASNSLSQLSRAFPIQLQIQRNILWWIIPLSILWSQMKLKDSLFTFKNRNTSKYKLAE